MIRSGSPRKRDPLGRFSRSHHAAGIASGGQRIAERLTVGAGPLRGGVAKGVPRQVEMAQVWLRHLRRSMAAGPDYSHDILPILANN